MIHALGFCVCTLTQDVGQGFNAYLTFLHFTVT